MGGFVGPPCLSFGSMCGVSRNITTSTIVLSGLRPRFLGGLDWFGGVSHIHATGNLSVYLFCVWFPLHGNEFRGSFGVPVALVFKS